MEFQTERQMVQHDVILQSLYSGKTLGEKFVFYDKAITQARTDVFFSLLFGGRIVCSAGSFFDSAIALRIFGELLTPSRRAACRRMGWYPLALNTDGPKKVSAPEFISSRWKREDARFSLFREFDSQIDWDEETLLRLKTAAADSISGEYWDNLPPLMEGLFKEHHRFEDSVFSPLREAELFPGGSITDDEHVSRSTRKLSIMSPREVRREALLNEHIGTWFENVLGYIKSFPDTFMSQLDMVDVDALKNFSPIDTIGILTDKLSEEDSESLGLNKPELQDLNKSFKSILADTSVMNPFFILGPEHYLHYYSTISNWAESGWHNARQLAYRSHTLVRSSDWLLKDVVGFDRFPAVNHFSNTAVDDSLEIKTNRYAKVDWEVLLNIVGLSSWSRLIGEIRDPNTRERGIDQLLGLLSRELSGFTFDVKAGRIFIGVNEIGDNISSMAAYSYVFSELTSNLDALLGIEISGATIGSVGLGFAAASRAPILKRILIPASRSIHEHYSNFVVRRANISLRYAAPLQDTSLP